MQHVSVIFKLIWRFKLGFLYLGIYGFILHKKSGLIFLSAVETLPPSPQLTYAVWFIRVSCNAIIYPS